MRTGLPVRRGGGRSVPRPGGPQLLDLTPFLTEEQMLLRNQTAAQGVIYDMSRMGALDRHINGIRAMVTVEEDHEDDLVITEHPVEYGAAITDHSYKRPSEVKVRVGWSQSGGFSHHGVSPEIDVRGIYNTLLALQNSRNPFTLVTGKREYINMLVAGIRVHTDARFESSFLADISLKQILLVSTQTLPASLNAGALANTQSNTPTSPQAEKQVLTSTMNLEQWTARGGRDPGTELNRTVLF